PLPPTSRAPPRRRRRPSRARVLRRPRSASAATATRRPAARAARPDASSLRSKAVRVLVLGERLLAGRKEVVHLVRLPDEEEPVPGDRVRGRLDRREPGIRD